MRDAKTRFQRRIRVLTPFSLLTPPLIPLPKPLPGTLAVPPPEPAGR